MRFLLPILLLSVVVACGKNGGSGTGSAQGESSPCRIDGEVVSCDSIYDGLGVDVLNAKISVAATVDGSRITFTEAGAQTAAGRRVSCSVSVRAGDSYPYSVSGNTLRLDTPEGNIDMKRVHGSGVMGMWRWTGTGADGASFQEKLLTVTKSRVILQKNCER